MPVYEAAAKCNLPLLFHTGNYRPNPADELYRRPVLKNMHPINLDRIARSFQSLKIVMAHMGTRIFQDEASQYIKMLPNLYADLGGCGQWLRMQPADLAEMLCSDTVTVDRAMSGFRKLVLGSDAYVTHPGIVPDGADHYLRLLRRIGVPKEIIDGIMGKTVASWMDVELDEAEE
ncbi:MAG: amidohydrolase family protein [Lentisphaeria bacterium]|nr:amidohydrolase family protein [Lentisphaeria bacterium]